MSKLYIFSVRAVDTELIDVPTPLVFHRILTTLFLRTHSSSFLLPPLQLCLLQLHGQRRDGPRRPLILHRLRDGPRDGAGVLPGRSLPGEEPSGMHGTVE